MYQPGVHFDVKTNGGVTLTEVAVRSDRGDRVECLKILADVGGVDWNVQMDGGDGDTPIMWCLKNGKMDRFNVLLECPRVDLNVRDSSGDTMALWALKNDKLEILKQFVGRVDVAIADKNGDHSGKNSQVRRRFEKYFMIPSVISGEMSSLKYWS